MLNLRNLASEHAHSPSPDRLDNISADCKFPIPNEPNRGGTSCGEVRNCIVAQMAESALRSPVLTKIDTVSCTVHPWISSTKCEHFSARVVVLTVLFPVFRAFWMLISVDSWIIYLFSDTFASTSLQQQQVVFESPMAIYLYSLPATRPALLSTDVQTRMIFLTSFREARWQIYIKRFSSEANRVSSRPCWQFNWGLLVVYTAVGVG